MSEKASSQCDENSIEELRRKLKEETTDSQKLLANPENNPIRSISIDQSIPAIVIVWKQYATSKQLRFIHEYLLELIKNSQKKKIFGDDTDLVTIHSEDQAWIIKNWLPRAVLLGLRAAASKRPTSYFGKMSVSDVLSAAPEEITMKSFDDRETARQWLKSFPT